MAGVTADTADNVGRIILLLGTVVLAMTDLTAVLASLVFIVAESSVKRSKFTQLVALELVLAFGDRGSLKQKASDYQIGKGVSKEGKGRGVYYAPFR